MHHPTEIIDAVKTALRAGRFGGDVVAVVGKLFARGQAWGFTDNFVALNDQLAAVGVGDDPFATQQGNGVLGAVMNGNKINKGVRLVGRQALASVVVNELVEAGGQAGKCKGGGHGFKQSLWAALQPGQGPRAKDQ